MTATVGEKWELFCFHLTKLGLSSVKVERQMLSSTYCQGYRSYQQFRVEASCAYVRFYPKKVPCPILQKNIYYTVLISLVASSTDHLRCLGNSPT